MASTSAPSSTATDAPVAALERASFVHRDGTTALFDVSIAVRIGVTAVLGPNGGGKSTLLALLAGRIAPTRGIATCWAPRVGYVAQGVELDPEMTAEEHIALFMKLERVPHTQREPIRSLLHQSLGLGVLPDTPVRTYSGGMKRRLHLALGLVASPLLFVADEPESGLDPGMRESLGDLLRAQGDCERAVVFASHDLALVERIADRIVVVSGGRVIADEPAHILVSMYGAIDSAYARFVGESEGGRTPGTRRRGRGRRDD